MIKKKLKKATLKKLYVTEQKSLATVARMLSCSPRTIRSQCVEQGIKIRPSLAGKRTYKILRTVFFDESQLKRLTRLSVMTKVPQQVYIREAINIALAKHEKRLKGKHKKRR
jgi:transposase-like protein